MLHELRRQAPNWTIKGGLPDASTHVLISGRANAEQLRIANRLEAIIVPFAGVPVPLREVVRDFPGISVHNLHHNAPETAEVAIALMLACAKSVVPMDRALRAGDWTPGYDDDLAIRLEGKTAVVLGFGAIGQRIARACLGLGMHVIAHRRNPQAGSEVDGVVVRGSHEIARSLTRADVLILAMPETPETTRMLGKDELGILKDGAILVNIARAKLVDEVALYHALESGRLRAAGLDVWYRYPEQGQAMHTFPANLPFHELPNVVMSPHRGGSSAEVELARMTALAELLNTTPMPNRVDLNLGY